MQLGRAYELENAFDRARAVYQALLTDARTTMTPTMECLALNRLAIVAAHGIHDLHTAAAFLHEAQSIAEQSGDTPGLAETEWNLAQLAVHASDPVSALAHGERALLYARTVDEPDLIARSLNVIAMTEGTLARWAEAEAHAEEARLLYKSLGNRAMEADCWCVIANAAINSGRPHEGIRAARAAATISREIENVWGQVNSAIHLTSGLLEIGDYSEALAVATQGVTLARAHDLWPGMRVLSLATLGTVQRSLFALDTARAMHAEALALNQATASRPPQMFAAELCTDDAVAGAWEEAYAYAQQARTPEALFYLYTGLRLTYQTEALVRGGADAEALADVQRFGACIGNNRRYQISYRWALALLAQASGTSDQAITQLQEAAAVAEAIGLPGEHWQIQAALGELYRAGGDQGRAREAFSRAAAIVHALADTIDDKALQATFLSAQPIRRVLGARERHAPPESQQLPSVS